MNDTDKTKCECCGRDFDAEDIAWATWDDAHVCKECTRELASSEKEPEKDETT